MSFLSVFFFFLLQGKAIGPLAARPADFSPNSFSSYTQLPSSEENVERNGGDERFGHGAWDSAPRWPP